LQLVGTSILLILLSHEPGCYIRTRSRCSGSSSLENINTRGDLSHMSGGSTASAPYTRKNGVLPVEWLDVMRINHNTVGTCCAHFLS